MYETTLCEEEKEEQGMTIFPKEEYTRRANKGHKLATLMALKAEQKAVTGIWRPPTIPKSAPPTLTQTLTPSPDMEDTDKLNLKAKYDKILYIDLPVLTAEDKFTSSLRGLLDGKGKRGQRGHRLPCLVTGTSEDVPAREDMVHPTMGKWLKGTERRQGIRPRRSLSLTLWRRCQPEKSR